MHKYEFKLIVLNTDHEVKGEWVKTQNEGWTPLPKDQKSLLTYLHAPENEGFHPIQILPPSRSGEYTLLLEREVDGK